MSDTGSIPVASTRSIGGKSLSQLFWRGHQGFDGVVCERNAEPPGVASERDTQLENAKKTRKPFVMSFSGNAARFAVAA